MIDLVELFQHWDAGRSKNELAASLGMDRKTVRKYLAPAEEEGLSPGQGLTPEQWQERIAAWFPGVRDARVNQVTWPHFDKHLDWVRGQLGAGVRTSTIYQRLTRRYGIRASESSFRRWFQATLGEEIAEARGRRRATALMPPTPPGALAQVDYGLLGRWTDPETKKNHRIWAFIITLPFSKQPFVYLTTKMDQPSWSMAHIQAFEFFGGVPARIMPDNLKTGVEHHDLYDPRINRAYRELAEHYGTLIDPARRAKPKDKPHVERMVQYVRGSFWTGQDFHSLEHMRREAVTWSREIAGRRKCRELGARTPWEVLEEEERPALKPLPARRLDIGAWQVGKVGSDCHVSVKGVLYSIPHRFIGKSLHVRLTEAKVDFFLDATLVKTHPRRSRGRQSDLSDYPPGHAEFLSRNPSWCSQRSEQIGPAAALVVGTQLADGTLRGLRSAQGIIRLSETFSLEQVDAACQGALDAGDPTLKTVKGIAINGGPLVAECGLGDGGAGALLRGPDAFKTTSTKGKNE